MYYHDPNNDPHKLSNSKDKRVNQIRVEIILDKIDKRIVYLIQGCVDSRRMFVLYSEDSAISFDINTNSSMQSNGIFTKYDNDIDFANGVKLTVATGTKIYMPPISVGNNDKKLLSL